MEKATPTEPTDPSALALINGVDAFTSEPFRGNPAVVCVLGAAASEAWMQAVAAEFNVSETAFLVPESGGWGLRWFTPAVEVDLCGHATLASAHVLWSTGRLPLSEPAVFRTRVSGVLSCRCEGDWVVMDFPLRPAYREDAPEGLLEALGCAAEWVGRTADDYLVQVGDPAVVRGLKPDAAALARLPVRGVIVTAYGDGNGYDFISRFFAPGVGVPEDPVTGSAHCSLAPFWAGRLGKTEMRGWQASARGGEVRVRLKGERVELMGQAVTQWQGAWTGATGRVLPGG